MCIASLIIRGVILTGITVSASPCDAADIVASAPLAPQSCQQLGGPLPCQVAQAGVWTYRIDDATFSTEAAAYAHMLALYGNASVFALAYRWGKSNPNPGAMEQVRSIETMSWKMYFRECGGNAKGESCEEFPRIAGYQRVRSIACAAGYQFSNDTSSPYCMPGNGPVAVAQAATHGTVNAAMHGGIRSALLR